MRELFDFTVLEKPKTPHNLIIIGDFLKDLDDEHSLCGVAGLSKLGFVSLKCVIGNLAPAELRARGAKGTLKMLGMDDVPVGIGTPVFEGKSYPYEAQIPYLADREEVISNGERLLVSELIDCPDKSVILVLQSGMTDAAKLLELYPTLFTKKIKTVAIMGGVETEGNSVKLMSDGHMTPNNANNNSFDMMSAIWLYNQLQRLNIPTVITTREVAYAAQVPFSAYNEYEQTGNPVGVCLKNRQLPSMQHLWEAACSPAGDAIRGTLPDDRDRSWFIKVFCNGKDPGIEDGGNIWPYVGYFNLYDPANLYAAIPELRDHFLKPTVVRVRDTDQLVIGVSSIEHGVLDVKEFAKFMVDIELLGLLGK